MRDARDRRNPWDTRDLKAQANAARVRSSATVAEYRRLDPAGGVRAHLRQVGVGHWGAGRAGGSVIGSRRSAGRRC